MKQMALSLLVLLGSFNQNAQAQSVPNVYETVLSTLKKMEAEGKIVSNSPKLKLSESKIDINMLDPKDKRIGEFNTEMEIHPKKIKVLLDSSVATLPQDSVALVACAQLGQIFAGQSRGVQSSIAKADDWATRVCLPEVLKNLKEPEDLVADLEQSISRVKKINPLAVKPAECDAETNVELAKFELAQAKRLCESQEDQKLCVRGLISGLILAHHHIDQDLVEQFDRNIKSPAYVSHFEKKKISLPTLGAKGFDAIQGEMGEIYKKIPRKDVENAFNDIRYSPNGWSRFLIYSSGTLKKAHPFKAYLNP